MPASPDQHYDFFLSRRGSVAAQNSKEVAVIAALLEL
jgi:hypothetical protein